MYTTLLLVYVASYYLQGNVTFLLVLGWHLHRQELNNGVYICEGVLGLVVIPRRNHWLPRVALLVFGEEERMLVVHVGLVLTKIRCSTCRTG